MPILGGWHHAERGTQQTGAPPLGTRGTCPQLGTLSQSHYNWLSGKESTCQHRRLKRHRFNSWVRKIPWRRKWQPTPAFLPGDSHRGAWKATVHGVAKSQTCLSTHTYCNFIFGVSPIKPRLPQRSRQVLGKILLLLHSLTSISAPIRHYSRSQDCNREQSWQISLFCCLCYCGRRQKTCVHM